MRLKVALWKLATPDCDRSVANKFSVCKSTVGIVVWEAINSDFTMGGGSKKCALK